MKIYLKSKKSFNFVARSAPLSSKEFPTFQLIKLQLKLFFLNIISTCSCHISPVAKKGGYRKHTQRTRARESSIDLVPFSAANITNLTSTRHDSLDDLDQVEELDDGLPVNVRNKFCSNLYGNSGL